MYSSLISNPSRSFPSSLFDFDKYSFENTIENLASDVEEETEDDDILANVKEVIQNEKRSKYF